MTFQNIRQAYTLAPGTSPIGWPLLENRDPTVNDVTYKVGQFWLNTSTPKKLWYLASQNTLVTATNPNGLLQSTWDLISIDSALSSLSDTANTPVFPSLSSATPPDNIQFTSSGGTVAITSVPASNQINFDVVSPQNLTFQTDVNSPSNPSGGIEKVFGGTITTNNTKGVQTDGSSGSNTLTVQLTNRITASQTTSDGLGQTQTLYTFALGGAAGTYLFTQKVVAFNKTDNLSAVYYGTRGVRTSGIAGTLINSNIVLIGEEGTFSEAEVVNSVSSNNAILTVTGIAGKTIDWYTLTDYIFVS